MSKMPNALYNLLKTAPPIAWYPFCEDSHTTGYTPNCSNETDGATLALVLTDFGGGESCGGGLLTTADGPTGSLLSGLQSALQLKNDLTLIIYHKSIDVLSRRFLLLCTNGNPDTNGTEANNPNYCIAIGVDNHLLCLHESGNGVEAVNTVDTGFIISNADTVSRTIVVKRNATAKTYMASVDGSAFSSGLYQYAPTGGTTCRLNLPLISNNQADGETRNVMIFDRQLTDSEILTILNSGNPSADWFDYSNWNGSTGAGYVTYLREGTVMIKELECFLAKKQATYGAQGDDLTGDNYFPALPDSKVEIITAMTDIETVSATYDHDLAVRGFVNANAELSCYMRSLGDATEPDYALLARASGWAVAGPTAGKYSLTPIINPTSATGDDLEVWHYLGGIGSNASVLTKIGNVVGNWKITGDVGKPVVFALTGAKGIFVSQAAATMVTSVVKDRTLIPAALPVTVSINSVVYKIMKFSFEGGNTVEQYIDCEETYGFGDSEITKKKIKFAFTCYANAALANPLDAVIAGAVVADVSIIWGTTLYKTKIVVDDPQFTDCKTVDVGGLTGWEVTGNATANDITITQNDDHV